MEKALSDLIAKLLDRKVSWTDRNGSVQQGILKEIRHDSVVVTTQPYGLVTPKRIKLAAANLVVDDVDGPRPRDHVTHSVAKDANGLWRWDIRIDGDIWRKRRGFRSQRAARESVLASLPEAEAAAENIFPTKEAICATFIWRAEFIRSKLGPADFYNGLTHRRKQLCEELVCRLDAT